MSKIDVNLPLSQFKTVFVTMYGDMVDDVSTYVVHHTQISTFIEATKRLHFKPGINPHNNGKTAVVKEISIGDFEARGPFWWSTPDLQGNYDSKGAILFESSNITCTIVWRHPDYVAAIEKENREMSEIEEAGG